MSSAIRGVSHSLGIGFDGEWYEDRSTVCITLLPLVCVVFLLIGQLFSHLCRPKAPKKASGSDEDEDSAAPEPGGTSVNNDMLSEPLVYSDRREVVRPISTFETLSQILQTRLSIWRQAVGAALLLLALGSFTGIQIASYSYAGGDYHHSNLPRKETTGLFCVALSALTSMQFYQSQVKRPVAELLKCRRDGDMLGLLRGSPSDDYDRRRESERRQCDAKEWIMLFYYAILLVIQCLRILYSVTSYRRKWSDMHRVFCVLAIVAEFVCLALCAFGTSLFVRSEISSCENVASIISEAYDNECISHIVPPAMRVAAISPRRNSRVAVVTASGRRASVMSVAVLEELDVKPRCPERTSSLFGRLTFWWLVKLLRTGRKETLDHSDLFAIDDDESAPIMYARLHHFLHESAGRNGDRRVKLGRVLWKFVNPNFIFASFLKIMTDSLSMLDIVLLNVLIKYITVGRYTDGAVGDLWTGLILCGLLALNCFCESVIINQYFHLMMSLGLNLRSALATAVYMKALRADLDSHTETASELVEGGDAAPKKQDAATIAAVTSSGSLINLMSTDAQRVGDVMSYIQILWSAPFQIIMASVMLYKQLGVAALGGLAVMILVGIPLTGFIASRTRILQKSMMTLKDFRLKSISELIQGIRVIKIYCWEQPFFDFITNVRDKELRALRKSQVMNSMSRFMIACIPILVALVSFMIYIFTGHSLTPAVAFTSLALFEKLRFPLFALPNVIMSSVEAAVTIKRLEAFFGLKDLPTCSTSEVDFRKVAAVNRNPFTQQSSDAEERDPSSMNEELVTSGKSVLCLENFSVSVCPRKTFMSTDDPDNSPRRPSISLIRSLSMYLKLGDYVAIVGRTGCGKSVLFNMILNEVGEDSTLRQSGRIIMKEDHGIALCTQTAWIRSGTVRENILFGREYKREWYKTVIKACALEADFKILPRGDLTEIGARGVNLSGGQKQRIALARAVYFDAHIYLLDDVLSAVDAHVAAHIYTRVIKGLLKDKAVLLATHRFECLDAAQAIYFLRKGELALKFDSLQEARANFEFAALADEDDKAARSPAKSPTNKSSPMKTNSKSPTKRASEIVATPKGSRSNDSLLLRSHSMTRSLELGLSRDMDINDEPEVVEEAIPKPDTPSPVNVRALVEKELVQEGKVSGRVYLSYVEAGGGWTVAVLLLLFLCSTAAASLGASFWLSHWSDDASMESKTGLTYYCAIQLSGLVLLVCALLMLIVMTQKAARHYHGKMLYRIIHAAIKFFESNPIGRLTNKFSKDLYTIDELLPMTLYQFMNMLIQVIAILIAISVVLPLMLAVIFPVLVVYYWTERLYVAVARQFKRLDSVSRSPLFTNFAETLDGTRVIRAMKQRGQFLNLHLRYLDKNLSAGYVYIASNRWLSVRLEALGNLIVAAVALFCVVMRARIKPGNSGLALNYAIQVTGFLNWLVRMSGDRESNIVAVERVIEYDEEENCPQEDYHETRILPANLRELMADPATSDTQTLVASSPDTHSGKQIVLEDMAAVQECFGEVELRSVALRYRPDLPFALRNVSFRISRGEKVGIVGRTGAGKSSLLVALLRMVELTEGQMLVHGIDASRYAVDELRSQIAIIPQETVIFSGTLRRNLDPFGKRTDEEIWRALEKSCLHSFVEDLPGKLDYQITENGTNVSVGQRQLLCLARVLLRRSSVLLLDEATCAVDPQTDAQIQKCLREEFEDTTIITIAHRLKTVLDYDRIIVMAMGSILEEGVPALLAKDRSSAFYQMLHSSPN